VDCPAHQVAQVAGAVGTTACEPPQQSPAAR